jgi:hypothetical protein
VIHGFVLSSLGVIAAKLAVSDLPDALAAKPENRRLYYTARHSTPCA